MNLFTQSPIEASLWTSFVVMQDWLVDNILLTGVFKAAVFTWIGFLLVKTVYRVGSGGRMGSAAWEFLLALVLSSIGLSILQTKSGESFRPVNAAGGTWTSSSKVNATGKYENLASANAHGLAFYVMIHRGANQIAEFVSGKIGELFRNPTSNKSPYLMLQTMAQTAGATIDDPKALSSMNWLFENCADGRSAKLIKPSDSYSALFELSKPDCADRYRTFRGELHAWAQGKWGTSWWNVGQIAVSQVGAKLGFSNEETLKNKMIASALVNTARAQMGQSKHNVSAGALLGTQGSDPQSSLGAGYFAAASNAFSLSGVANTFLKPITGVDFWAADNRNQSAAAYNRIIQFMPPIRGYAKGLLALAFVFAAAALSFGSPRYMMAWMGMLLVFTAYGPLSTLLYETTMMFSNAKEVTDAMGALRNDPLVLSGAAIVDDNLARIQAVYFALQLGLAGMCAVGGMSIFVFAKRLGGGLTDGLVGKTVAAIHTVAFVRNAAAVPKGGENG